MTEEHYNQLTPVEDELLALLAEECAEVIQAITKIQRHGFTGRYSTGKEAGRSNRQQLQVEMGDVRAAMILLCNHSIVSKAAVHQYAEDKLNQPPYFHHATVKR